MKRVHPWLVSPSWNEHQRSSHVIHAATAEAAAAEIVAALAASRRTQLPAPERVSVRKLVQKGPNAFDLAPEGEG